MLRLAGFRCITDRALVREETLYHRMRAGEAEFLALLEQISFEFQVRRPSARAIGRATSQSAATSLQPGTLSATPHGTTPHVPTPPAREPCR